jgi:hypothetical protein
VFQSGRTSSSFSSSGNSFLLHGLTDYRLNTPSASMPMRLRTSSYSSAMTDSELAESQPSAVSGQGLCHTHVKPSIAEAATAASAEACQSRCSSGGYKAHIHSGRAVRWPCGATCMIRAELHMRTRLPVNALAFSRARHQRHRRTRLMVYLQDSAVASPYN